MLPLEKEHITNIAYDTVIFGFTGDKLKILILEYQNSGLFALPGGFIRRDENLYDAVKRGVRERTGLDKIHLEQFHTFGKKNRDSAYPFKKIAAGKGYPITSDHWVLDRFITVGYYALIDYNQVKPTPDKFSDSIAWHSIDKLPPLMIDHEEIVEKAIEAIRNDLGKKPIGTNLLPKKFTMKELQKVYEIILNKEFRRTTFQRKMLSLDFLKRHEKLYTGAANKAPYLYSFDESKVEKE
ncbi:NUDIX hydrolase [Flagellimonas zhangzhouensis]|uniref:ADP-ribose pyrophosphatase YjhB, NUDIX family n=1 Tax=Flagellimonas zhangzhouensis TaxID=1073328 RepID=A0A1H2YAN4_9FLAO|nr:NUDIX domain-containing protein [Allomuricauda zhangzhouensis]SDQ97651.1 ADP-ribose pyrophosphatase YjhB, NUDIX family [Allomuricauda zhangzhouensis]SDX02273.1 ADP-ribose pyrophosphatase YjhB, NUDIX family [Allomuricauda zhangzhouensis]